MHDDEVVGNGMEGEMLSWKGEEGDILGDNV